MPIHDVCFHSAQWRPVAEDGLTTDDVDENMTCKINYCSGVNCLNSSRKYVSLFSVHIFHLRRNSSENVRKWYRIENKSNEYSTSLTIAV